MVEVASEEQLTQVILPALLARAEDPVPNVKFNVCKVLEVRRFHLSQTFMKPGLLFVSYNLSRCVVSVSGQQLAETSRGIQCAGWLLACRSLSQRILSFQRPVFCVQKLAPKFDGPVVTNQVLPVLSMLSEDSDTDVQFFATQAMTCFTP